MLFPTWLTIICPTGVAKKWHQVYTHAFWKCFLADIRPHWTRRVPLIPICCTISISHILTNMSTCFCCWCVCQNVRNGDCATNGDEWHTPALDGLWLTKTNHMHHRTSTESIRQSMSDIWFCISWSIKSQHAASHIDWWADVCHSSPFCGQSPFRTIRQLIHPAFVVDVFDELFEMEIVHKIGRSGTRLLVSRIGRCAISGFVSLGQKTTTCSIAHRPIRFASRSQACATPPHLLTISISTISSNASTSKPGWWVWRNGRNGDCPTNGEEWHTPGRRAISGFVTHYRTSVDEKWVERFVNDFMHPKRRFWKTKPQVGRVSSRYFARVWVLDLGY